VDPSCLTLIEAAVAGAEGRVRFHVGDPSAWYGQAIDPNQPRPASSASPFAWLRSSLARRSREEERAIVEVRAVTLAEILDELDLVDLIDLDVQGVEAEVLEPVGDSLTAKVKRVHIGTHSVDNERRLRTLFADLGWENLNDYPHAAEATTPWGLITFQDGVQTWRNPTLR
jgi:FkbM family methyltransferase